MCFRRRLFRIWPLLGRPCLMCFGIGALKMRDRIQTIPFEVIPKAARALSTMGALLRTSNFYFPDPLLLGGRGGLSLK